MGTIDISYYNLFIGLLLLAIPFFYLWKFKTGLLKPAVIGTLRMIIQLFFIGIYLKYLFLWNNPWINFLWVIIMIFVAGQTALVRTQLKRSILLIPISIGFLCSVVVVGLYFIGVVLQLDNIFSAQYFIPIFGILMGNMLSSNVIALNTYYSGLKREQQLYRYLLGNGATRQEAQAPFIKQAIIKSFSPLIANIAVMGLVALPGTMIGQILGGSSPNVAIKYQMMIMVITFTASMLSLMITISLASRRSFERNEEMTVTDRIFQNVAELSVPNFFITVEFSVMGNEMPEHIESFVLEKYQAILHGANGRKFVYTEGGWRLFFTFFPTDKVVDERYALKNKVQMKFHK